MSNMTPREIVHELDKHIVGQDNAKRAVAIALSAGEGSRSSTPMRAFLLRGSRPRSLPVSSPPLPGAPNPAVPAARTSWSRAAHSCLKRSASNLASANIGSLSPGDGGREESGHSAVSMH